MWWAIGIGGIVYLILVFTLGLATLRNGHGWMFFFGIFLPVFWLFGAFMRPSTAAVGSVEPKFDVRPSPARSHAIGRIKATDRARANRPQETEVDASGLVTIALLVLAYAAVSRRLSGTVITAAMVFVAGGILASDEVLGWLDPTIGSETVRWVAEATLTVVSSRTRHGSTSERCAASTSCLFACSQSGCR